jgi:hypothetical protein
MLEKPARDKHTSLFGQLLSYKEKMFFLKLPLICCFKEEIKVSIEMNEKVSIKVKRTTFNAQVAILGATTFGITTLNITTLSI